MALRSAERRNEGRSGTHPSFGEPGEPGGRGRSGRRRARRRRGLLALAAGALVLAAFVFCLAATRGVEGLVRLFTVPSLEAKSGRKYTPQGAVKRLIEKIGEEGRSD